MKIALINPRGEVPRLASHLLPENAAQAAVGARLLTGDITAWNQFSITKTLATAAPVRTIYLLDDKWLSWGWTWTWRGDHLATTPIGPT